MIYVSIYAKFHCDAKINTFINKQMNKLYLSTEQLIFVQWNLYKWSWLILIIYKSTEIFVNIFLV